MYRCDFNYRDINWHSWSTFHNEESKEPAFIETINDCYFNQHNLENSRRRGNDEPSLIDLVFTDGSMQVSDVHHQAPLGKSDHNALTFKFNCYLDYSKPQERFVYDKANFDDMRKNLAEEKRCDNFIASVNVMSIEQLGIQSKRRSLVSAIILCQKISSEPD